LTEQVKRQTKKAGATDLNSNDQMNIERATRSYERWMRRCAKVIEADVADKHRRMKWDPFLFFRGTFYRWAQLWPEICAEEAQAPRVVAVGDLHVGSFGTWTDQEGRLAWGVDDFDEAYSLPYTNDLARLATSVKLGIDAGHLSLDIELGCGAILEGYQSTLQVGGCPLVLAEHHHNLRRFGFEAINPPRRFWRGLRRLPRARQVGLDLKRVFQRALPNRRLAYNIVRREAGLGSLGQQRFVAVARWQGGLIAREAKAILPSSMVWVSGQIASGQPYYEHLLRHAIRSPDPVQAVMGRWIVRRLSPESNPIEIERLPKTRDEEQLLHAMGTEAANVHMASRSRVPAILKDLRRRKPKWLRQAAKAMAKAVERDWKEYRR
jgi:hypothetical protein